MRIADDRRHIIGDFPLERNVVHFQVVLAQHERFFQHLAEIDFLLLRLALASKGEQVLHYPMRPLRLLEQFAHVLSGTLIETRALEQLRVTEDCRERIIQLVRYSGNQLADG